MAVAREAQPEISGRFDTDPLIAEVTAQDPAILEVPPSSDSCQYQAGSLTPAPAPGHRRRVTRISHIGTSAITD